jgi:hypothetical protein
MIPSHLFRDAKVVRFTPRDSAIKAAIVNLSVLLTTSPAQ